jgi:uncharacterized protein YndB with AHSA1/START domain
MKTTPFTFERTFSASLEEVWDLWTTREGIEAWWGPDGFEVKVLALDLKPQGQLVYAQTATAAPQIEFLKRAGMPLTTQARLTYVELVAPRRLHYIQLADFIPGTKPYDVNALVELSLRDGKVKMVLTHDTMHDERWTNLARMGWESELGRLTALLKARRQPGVDGTGAPQVVLRSSDGGKSTKRARGFAPCGPRDFCRLARVGCRRRELGDS